MRYVLSIESFSFLSYIHDPYDLYRKHLAESKRCTRGILRKEFDTADLFRIFTMEYGSKGTAKEKKASREITVKKPNCYADL